MTPALALSALLWLQATPAQPSQGTAFQPRLKVSFQPISRLPLKVNFQPISPPRQRGGGDQEIICGMVVIHKTSADDPKIVLPPRKTGAAVRRIEPEGCAAKAIPVVK